MARHDRLNNRSIGTLIFRSKSRNAPQDTDERAPKKPEQSARILDLGSANRSATIQKNEAHKPTFRDAYEIYRRTPRGRIRFLNRLMQSFGDTPLWKIDEAFLHREAEKLYPGRSLATQVRQVWGPFLAVRRTAEKCGRGPFQKIKKPWVNSKTRMRWLDPNDFDAFINAKEDHLSLLFHLAVGTGAAPGELFELDWDAVDLARREIYFGTEDRGRAVAITADLAAFLEVIPDKEGAVIKRPDGNKYASKKVQGSGGQSKTALNTRCRHAGISDFHLTDLQSTYAVWHLAENNRDFKKLKRDSRWRYEKINRFKSLSTADLDRVRQQLLERRTRAHAKTPIHATSPVALRKGGVNG
jgi:integrase